LAALHAVLSFLLHEDRRSGRIFFPLRLFLRVLFLRVLFLRVLFLRNERILLPLRLFLLEDLRDLEDVPIILFSVW
tara:strand:+ start:2261 stop:2488 length:228 start_codon:yes stop_codon:yes gene_type:complete